MTTANPFWGANRYPRASLPPSEPEETPLTVPHVHECANPTARCQAQGWCECVCGVRRLVGAKDWPSKSSTSLPGKAETPPNPVDEIEAMVKEVVRDVYSRPPSDLQGFAKALDEYERVVGASALTEVRSSAAARASVEGLYSALLAEISSLRSELEKAKDKKCAKCDVKIMPDQTYCQWHKISGD